MQNWKEKASELGQWELKGVPILYPILFITLLIPILFWNVENIRCFDDFTIADNSARYLLSALVQSLAAIIAIVVTMTLVAVQLTASAYSPRVIDIFKKDWVMWLLLVWYGLSIFFGLFVLEMIGGEYQNLGHWGVSLEFCVFLAYSMGIIAFVGLFWHIGNVINLLKPENVIEKVSESITIEKVLKYIESEEKQRVDRTQPVKDDPMLQIVSVINSLIMKYDFESVKDGLKAITDLTIEVMGNLYLFSVSSRFKNDLRRGTISEEFNNEFKKRGYSLSENLNVEKIDFTPRTTKWRIHDENGREMYRVIEGENEELTVLIDLDREIKVSGYFCRHFEGIIRLTTEKYEASTIDVIESLETLGMSTAEKKLEYATKEVLHLLDKWIKVITERGFEGAALHTVSSLGKVGNVAAGNKLEDAAKQAADSLGVVGNYAAENKLKYATSEAARSLGLIGSVAAEEKLEEVVNQVVESLGSVGMVAMVNELDDAAWQATSHLESVGRVAVKKEFTDAAEQAALHLGRIGKVAAVNRFERVANEAANSIGSIGKVAVEEERRSVVIRAIESLGSLGEIAAEQGLKIATLEAARQLGLVGEVAAEKGLKFKSDVERVIEWLRSVGEIAVGNNGLEKTIYQVASRFVSIGIVAEKELKIAAHRAARCLAELTISSKKIVENVIEPNRRGLKENEQEFFNKFRNTYEHELEELCTRNPDHPPMR